MPTALDRLLASPSALRALRNLLARPEFPTIAPTTTQCCFSSVSRRQHRLKPAVAQKSLDDQAGSLRGKHDSHTRRKIPLESELHTSLWGRIAKRRTGDQTELLARALSYADRIHGATGVREMWVGVLRHRYNLPTADTTAAGVIWDAFLKHEELVMSVLNHAAHLLQTTGEVYPTLYLKCMEYWLPRNPDIALHCHHRMLIKLHLRKLPLRELVRRTRHSPPALKALMDIYRTSNERNVYDEIVPIFCDRNELEVAHRWHMMCYRRGDHPSSSVESHPMVQLFLAGSSIEAGNEDGNRTTYSKLKVYSQRSIYNEEFKLRLQGRKTAPVRFDDAFCAKLFATKAFQPTSIIHGLLMVGINEIGPQALRVLGLRTEPLEELPTRLHDLKAAGIAVQGCVYTLALEKFAQEGKFRLVRSMLESDQHPDVFGDSELQRKLLDYYVDQHDWVQAHRTLAILTLFHNDAREEHWNLILQAHIKRFHTDAIVQVLQDMRTHMVLVSIESFAAIRTLLRPRQRGRKPTISQHGRFDDLRFVTRLFIMILESGIGYIPPPAWYEIIRRYGMLTRIKELGRLCFWLLSWYTPRGKDGCDTVPKPEFLDFATQRLRIAYPDRFYRQSSRYLLASADYQNYPIRQLFPPSLQQAFIAWGFQAGLGPAAPLEQSIFSSAASKKHSRRRLKERGILNRCAWSEGLKLLVKLRDHGVRVHHHTVVKALEMQFVNLFGSGWSSRRSNRIMKRSNTKPYQEYVNEVNTIWGQPLFTDLYLHTRRGQNRETFHPRLPRQKRRSFLLLDEIIGPNWRNKDAPPVVELSSSQSPVSPTNAEKTRREKAGQTDQRAI